jgi:hypothetical protein
LRPCRGRGCGPVGGAPPAGARRRQGVRGVAVSGGHSHRLLLT